jgi:hypothetical protein
MLPLSPNEESVPVPPSVPEQTSGVHRVTVCGAPDVLFHVTVSPTFAFASAGA